MRHGTLRASAFFADLVVEMNPSGGIGMNESLSAPYQPLSAAADIMQPIASKVCWNLASGFPKKASRRSNVATCFSAANGLPPTPMHVQRWVPGPADSAITTTVAAVRFHPCKDLRMQASVSRPAHGRNAVFSSDTGARSNAPERATNDIYASASASSCRSAEYAITSMRGGGGAADACPVSATSEPANNSSVRPNRDMFSPMPLLRIEA